MTAMQSPTPPASPLVMPTQVLSRRPAPRMLSRDPSTGLARALTFGGSLVLTAAASQQMYLILPLGGLPVNDAATVSPSVALWLSFQLWLLLSLFTVTFGWIALSATTALAGLLPRRDRQGLHAQAQAALQGKTVLLMPIYNEDAASACAALAAMGEELGRLGLPQKGEQQKFEIFILSDTNAPDIAATEMAAVQRLRGHLSGIMPVWYRRREQNKDRKAGNIRDFIKRWGSGYDYMVVLDADSLIAGQTLTRLVREMDADPTVGLLQTLPRLCGGQTLFARLQQFAGATYGSVFARGLSAWQGHDGNYWGHNAIIRIRAFAESASLPTMPGPRPFGGEIRSHDFVEAALIRRAGWAVRMLPDLAGSWEECPPTLLDASIRDRRWAQGNVQHLAVVATRGLRWPNRVHMLMGVMNYLTSLLWLAMITVGLLLSVQFAVLQVQGLPGEVPPMFDAERMIGLFIFTMILLLLPKILGLVGGLLSSTARGGAGRLRFFLSVLLELVFSILHAPIFMLMLSQHLWEIARGQDSGWAVQRRQSSGLNWRLLLARHGVHTLLGLLVTLFLLWLSAALLYWMLPIVIGLLMAIPLSAFSGSARAGQWLARRGLLDIPEELAPPKIMKRRQAFLETLSR